MKKEQIKKWLLSTAMLLAGTVGAQAQVTENSEYLLHLDGSDFYLSAETAKTGNNAELTLQTAGTDGFSQAFVFSQANGGYNISVGDGVTVVRDSWYMRYKNTGDVNLESKDAIFAVETSGDGIKLKNLGTGKYVGCDSRNSGSKVYSDKSGDRVCVFIPEPLNDQFYIDRLNAAITEARNYITETEEGTDPGQYPAEARTALTDAITAAESALNGDIDGVKDAIKALSAAVEAYLSAKNPIEFAAGFYRLAYKGIAGTYLSNGWQANSWEPSNVMSTGIILNENEDGYNQQFMLSKTGKDAAANGYNIRDKDGYYMYNSNGNFVYDETNVVDPDSKDAIFLLEEDGDYVRIVSVATGKYVGPVDNTLGWTWIHVGTNYSGPTDGCRFTPEFLGADVAGMLQDLIDEALALLETTEEGDQPGQYPADARKDLSDKISEAQTALAGGDNDAMLKVMNSLKLEMTYYNDRVIAAHFDEGVYKFYHVALPGALLASGWHANSWESWNVEHTALILNESEAGEYNAEFTVAKAPATAEFSGYNILDNENNPLVNADGKLLVDENTALDETNALFVFDEGSEGLRIRSLGTGKNVGPVDDTKGWSWIHAGTKHSGTDNGDLFRSELIRSSAISDVVAESGVVIDVEGNLLRVYGAGSVSVYNVTGVRVATLGANGCVELQNGIYVVVANTASASKVAKICIK